MTAAVARIPDDPAMVRALLIDLLRRARRGELDFLGPKTSLCPPPMTRSASSVSGRPLSATGFCHGDRKLTCFLFFGHQQSAKGRRPALAAPTNPAPTYPLPPEPSDTPNRSFADDDVIAALRRAESALHRAEAHLASSPKPGADSAAQSGPWMMRRSVSADNVPRSQDVSGTGTQRQAPPEFQLDASPAWHSRNERPPSYQFRDDEHSMGMPSYFIEADNKLAVRQHSLAPTDVMTTHDDETGVMTTVNVRPATSALVALPLSYTPATLPAWAPRTHAAQPSCAPALTPRSPRRTPSIPQRSHSLAVKPSPSPPLTALTSSPAQTSPSTTQHASLPTGSSNLSTQSTSATGALGSTSANDSNGTSSSSPKYGGAHDWNHADEAGSPVLAPALLRSPSLPAITEDALDEPSSISVPEEETSAAHQVTGDNEEAASASAPAVPAGTWTSMASTGFGSLRRMSMGAAAWAWGSGVGTSKDEVDVPIETTSKTVAAVDELERSSGATTSRPTRSIPIGAFDVGDPNEDDDDDENDNEHDVQPLHESPEPSESGGTAKDGTPSDDPTTETIETPWGTTEFEDMPESFIEEFKVLYSHSSL